MKKNIFNTGKKFPLSQKYLQESRMLALITIISHCL